MREGAAVVEDSTFESIELDIVFVEEMEVSTSVALGKASKILVKF